MKRGDVVTVALPGDYGKPRPAVVVQADHFNGIQPWKVNRDGSIQNALF